MKKYIRSAKDLPDDQLAIVAEKLKARFKENGVEVRVTTQNGGYWDTKVYFHILSIDGDETGLYKGQCIVVDDYMCAIFTDVGNPWYVLGYNSEEEYCSDENITEFVDKYTDKLHTVLDKFTNAVAEAYEIEPEFESFTSEFLNTYADEFPNLKLTVKLQTMTVNWAPYKFLDMDKQGSVELYAKLSVGKKEELIKGTYDTFMSGQFEQEVYNNASRLSRMIAKGLSESNAGLVKVLNNHGIDTTKHKYELFAESYERYSKGDKYKKKFTCAGDYLAYFAMCLHTTPNYVNISDYFGDIYDFEEEFVENYPTVDDMKDYASSHWWGDGDDYIIYLKNLDTGEYLYGPEEVEEYYDEEDEWED